MSKRKEKEDLKQTSKDYLHVLGEYVKEYLKGKTVPLCHRDKGTCIKEEDVIGSIEQGVEAGG